jgi:hypothetical protein
VAYLKHCVLAFVLAGDHGEGGRSSTQARLLPASPRARRAPPTRMLFRFISPLLSLSRSLYSTLPPPLSEASFTLWCLYRVLLRLRTARLTPALAPCQVIAELLDLSPDERAAAHRAVARSARAPPAAQQILGRVGTFFGIRDGGGSSGGGSSAEGQFSL